MTASALDTAVANLRAWREDPVRFVREVFQAEPDAWQLDVLRAFPTHQRLAMKACKGPGKTCLLAWLVWNFLLTRPWPKIAATSITGDNLADCLWTELSKWQHRAPLLKHCFTWTNDRVFSKEHPETWWASARTWPKSADTAQQADTLAGLHGDYLLFVLDEAGGIPDGVMAAAEAGLASGIETKLVQAGNPTACSGPLYRACTTEAHLWHVTEITADPDDPKRTPRVSEQWAREQIQKYGRDSPWVMVNVLGKFPPTALNSLLGPDDVASALGRHLREDQFSFAPRVVGVDVARFGDDRTVIAKRQGLAWFPPIIMRNARTNEIAARVARELDEWEADGCFVDDTGGYGAGVVDALIQSRHRPISVQFSGKPTDERYLNKRAEMWFEMAAAVKGGAALPNLPELQRELTAPLYDFRGGKFKLEEKDAIKARLGESPDIADAYALTFAQHVRPRGAAGMPYRPRAAAKPYDPARRLGR